MRAIAVGMALLAGTLAAQEPVVLRTRVRPEGEVWIGARTSVEVTVLMSLRPDYSPRFDIEPLDGALFFQAPGSPVLGTEQVDGSEYTSQQFELMLFAQREGPIDVPAIRVRTTLSGKEHTVTTEPLQVRARRPEGFERGSPVISTPELTIEVRWNPEPRDAKVGDAFERTIMIRASNVMGLAIPPAPVPMIDGLAAYPGEPVVEDKLQRGTLSTTRTDVVTLICERPGAIEVPALIYRWWNPEAQRIEQQELPTVTFEVKAVPTHEDEAVEVKRISWGAAATGVFLMAVLLGLWLARRPLRRRWNQWEVQRQEREEAYFRRLIVACQVGDPAAAWGALVAWLERGNDSRRTLGMRDLAPLAGGAAFVREAEDLQRALLDAGSKWSGERMVAVLEGMRRQPRAVRAQGAGLPPLNRRA